MVEIKFGVKTVDLPYSIRLYGVTEEMFDGLTDEDMKAELIDGVMLVHSPASLRHDEVSGFIRALMSFYAEERGLGKVLGPDGLIHLATGRRFAPDLFFIRKGRLPTPLPEQFEGVPDLIVEILSPSNRNNDLVDKRPAYHEAGVEEIWFVDPDERQVLVDRRRRRSYSGTMIDTGKFTSTVLNGFWLETSWLWAEPLPNRMACLRKILRGSR